MSDDKPKHKPQQKHTLSEVLKSLQDLIRTDLVTAPAKPSPPAESTPERPPPAPTEPDSFGEALDQLDEIITHKIIEPVERAQETPPEPLLPDETLEIEWDEPETIAAETIEIEPAAAPPEVSAERDETIELQPVAPELEEPSTPSPPPVNNVVELEIIQVESKADNEPDTIELEPAEPAAETTDNVVEFQTTPADATEAVNLLSAYESDDVAPDTIELPAEPVGAQSKETQKPPAAENREAAGSPAAASDKDANPQRELFETHVVPPAPPLEPAEEEVTTIALDDAPAPRAAPATADINPPSALSDSGGAHNDGEITTTTKAEGGEEIPALMVDFDVSQLSATPDEMTTAKTSGTTERSAPAAAPEARPPVERSDAAVPPTIPLEPAPPAPSAPALEKAQAAPEVKEKPARPKASAPKPADQNAPPKQEEIPVLKEVADLNAPPSPPLPGPGQARDIAIRVIAKLNIERRKAGETPLDIKTIEKLQQYLTDALAKRALHKPK